ncbi:MAG: hypothetical protein MI976_10100 [Pseudomonadales bacterium]|nr:hypothetical protein [Pseudomonadales bacterium]
MGEVATGLNPEIVLNTYIPVICLVLVALSNFQKQEKQLVGNALYFALMTYSGFCFAMGAFMAIVVQPDLFELKHQVEFVGLTYISIGNFLFAGFFCRLYAKRGQKIRLLRTDNNKIKGAPIG